MGTQSTWRWAIAASALALTTACGGQATPEASGSTSVPSPTADPAPSTSSPTSSTPAIDPNIPAAARAHTPAGAEAFAKFYVEQLNRAFIEAKRGSVQSLASTNCRQCAEYGNAVDALASKEQHYAGRLISVQRSESGPDLGSDSTVMLRMTQERVALVDANGSTVNYSNRKSGDVTVVLGWANGHWSVHQFRYTA